MCRDDFEFKNINNTSSGYESIHELFELQVQKMKDNIALKMNDKEMTYCELNGRADSIAHRLGAEGIKSNNVVAIIGDCYIDIICAILGVSKAGSLYLPIDPGYSQSTINNILMDPNICILLAIGSSDKKISFSGKIIYLNTPSLYDKAEPDCLPTNVSGTPVYVIYKPISPDLPESMTTGHRSVASFSKGIADAVDFSVGRTVLILTSISFHLLIIETLLFLTKGLKVVIVNENEQVSPNWPGKVVTDEKIDIVYATSASLELLINNDKESDYMKNVKTVLICGEIFPTDLTERLSKVTDANIYNICGSAETSVWSPADSSVQCNLCVAGKSRDTFDKESDAYDIEKKVIYLLDKHIDIRLTDEEINMDDNLESIGLNSITYIEVIVAIEKEYGIEFDDEFLGMDSFDTVRSLVNYIQQKRRDNKIEAGE